MTGPLDRLFGAAPGPPLPDLEKVYDAIRDVRAEKTPSAWTEAERRLFRMLPEGRDEKAVPNR